MQNSLLKFLPIFGLILLFLPFVLTANPQTLKQADSLFTQKRYTQSLELYKELFAHNQYTPAMLLKMAFIEEGLGRNATALYYLNIYQQTTVDPTVGAKMEELANKNSLKGYASSEIDRIWFLYRKYETIILFSLLAICAFFFLFAINQKRKQQPALAFWILAFAFAIPLVWLNNHQHTRQYAIIAKPQTYIMNGPSAGASVVDIVAAGHRVQVLGKDDIWVRVAWNDHTGYIKEGSLLSVAL